MSLSLLITGCYADERDDPGLHEFRATIGCQGCGICGSNSPSVNNFGIPELRLDGLANADGIRLVGVRRPNKTLYTLDVVDDEFVARNGTGVVATGDRLVGWTIELLDANDDLISVYINSYDSVPGLDNATTSITAYGLIYVPANDPATLVNVCPNSDVSATAITLIRGETYRHVLHRPGHSDHLAQRGRRGRTHDPAAVHQRRIGGSSEESMGRIAV